MSGYVLFDSLLAPYIITGMDVKQLKNIIQTTFPGLSINNFSILGDGKYAYACLVNDKIVFKIPKLEDEYMNDQDKEVNILQHLANKLCVRIPEILYGGHSVDGKYIIGESFLNGITYTQELHDSFDEKTKSDILQQIGRIMRNLHDCAPSDYVWLNRNVETYIDNLDAFNKYCDFNVRKALPKDIINSADNLAEKYKQISSEYPATPVFVHCDLHFGNMIFDCESKRITGLIDFGAAHYAEPARDMHYYYGTGAKDILTGYGDNGDQFLPIRQQFQSVINMMCNIQEDLQNHKLPDNNIKKLKLCLSLTQ